MTFGCVIRYKMNDDRCEWRQRWRWRGEFILWWTLHVCVCPLTRRVHESWHRKYNAFQFRYYWMDAIECMIRVVRRSSWAVSKADLGVTNEMIGLIWTCFVAQISTNSAPSYCMTNAIFDKLWAFSPSDCMKNAIQLMMLFWKRTESSCKPQAKVG